MTTTAEPDPCVLRLRPEATERLEALIVGRGAHLVDVLDIGTAANGDLLVVLPAPAVRLTELVVAPGGLTAGEAVTVLVPLVQALHRLHEAGVAHGGIVIGSVVVDADGSPAWTAPEAPVLLRRAGPARFAEHAAADLAAFRVLCALLLSPLALPVPSGDDPEVLAGGLYALAPAEPVRLVRSSAAVPVSTPARLLPAVQPTTRADGVRNRGRGPLAVALATAGGVRPRAWIALGGIGALLVAALVALPTGDDGAPAAVHASRSASPTPTSSPTPTVVAGRGLDGGAAVAALLAERDRCLAAGSEACLRRVDAAASPVLQADVDAIGAGTDAIRVDPSQLRVPSGAGGTALATSRLATVLAVRQQDGWRLRDVVAEPPAEG